MNLADQAAHAIVIASRKMNVDPISVLLRNVDTKTRGDTAAKRAGSA